MDIPSHCLYRDDLATTQHLLCILFDVTTNYLKGTFTSHVHVSIARNPEYYLTDFY